MSHPKPINPIIPMDFNNLLLNQQNKHKRINLGDFIRSIQLLDPTKYDGIYRDITFDIPNNVDYIDISTLPSDQTHVPLTPSFPNYEIEIAYPHRVKNIRGNKYLTPKLNKDDYNVITIGKRHLKHHRLVAQKFILNPNNLPYVDHIDHNRTNNSISNLRWSSEKENSNNKCTMDFVNTSDMPDDLAPLQYYLKGIKPIGLFYSLSEDQYYEHDPIYNRYKKLKNNGNYISTTMNQVKKFYLASLISKNPQIFDPWYRSNIMNLEY
jgi:hypothetical protein